MYAADLAQNFADEQMAARRAIVEALKVVDQKVKFIQQSREDNGLDECADTYDLGSLLDDYDDIASEIKWGELHDECQRRAEAAA